MSDKRVEELVRAIGMRRVLEDLINTLANATEPYELRLRADLELTLVHYEQRYDHDLAELREAVRTGVHEGLEPLRQVVLDVEGLMKKVIAVGEALERQNGTKS